MARLTRKEERQIDTAWAQKNIHCFVCGGHIQKQVQRGSGWSSGFYIRCRTCGNRGFHHAHNTCVPLGLHNDSWLGSLIRWLNPNIEGYRLVVDECEKCGKD